jgi:hypothetical protein
MDKPRFRLSIGPIQFHWPRAQMLDFYTRIESSAADIVYLGETVCSKRRELRHQDWLDIAERLLVAGKEVVFSTLALVEARSELGYIRKLCSNGRFLVEANDMSAVQMLAGKVNFVGGATLNLQNAVALNHLVDLPSKCRGACFATYELTYPTPLNARCWAGVGCHLPTRPAAIRLGHMMSARTTAATAAWNIPTG